MQENAARNCYEFASENWDWKQAVEDEGMVQYGGERIHPIHFMDTSVMYGGGARSQLMTVMSEQQQQQQQQQR